MMILTGVKIPRALSHSQSLSHLECRLISGQLPSTASSNRTHEVMCVMYPVVSLPSSARNILDDMSNLSTAPTGHTSARFLNVEHRFHAATTYATTTGLIFIAVAVQARTKR